MSELRIVSFLPSGTELVCALSLAEHLMGISHECDFPLEICGKPVVVHSAIPVGSMSLKEIDLAVSQQLRSGASLYQVDEVLLRELSPTLILTQNLCQVCAPAGNEVTRALNALPIKPEVLWMSPHCIADIHTDLRALAQATSRLHQAEQLISEDRARLDAVAQAVQRSSKRPRVFCAEWIDPIYCCGHWVPEMVEIAGGIDVLGRKWADSVRVSWEDVEREKPEVLVIMPCGFDLSGSIAQAELLINRDACLNLPAVQTGQVYAVDAAYFSRPSLRVVDGTELLAHLLHPEVFSWRGRADAFRQISLFSIESNPQSSRICPSCGGTFCCGLESSAFRCWCAHLPLMPITGDRCLCPSCLKATIQLKMIDSHPSIGG